MLDHLSDREFNEIFKKVSESKEFEYNPDAWALIKPRLERKKRRKRIIAWLWGLGGLSAIILTAWFSFGTGVGEKNGASDVSGPPTPSMIGAHDQSPEENVDNSLANGATNNNSLPAGASLQNERAESNNRSTNEHLDGASATQSTNNIQRSVGTISSEASSDETVQAATKNRINREASSTKTSESLKNGISASPTDRFIENKNAVTDHVHNLEEASTSETKPIEKPANNEVVNSAGHATTEGLQPETPLSITNPEIDPLIIQLSPPKLPFGISDSPGDADTDKSAFIGIEIYAGREWSTSSLSYFRKGDYKLGLGMSYPISSKLSTSVGVGYHVDRYGAGEGLYKPPQGFWTEGIAPIYTTANCKILDIPLGLNYHYSGATESGFYTSLAVTSIFMLREDYIYNYRESKPNQKTSWSGVNANNHLFNDLYISTGYQLKTSNAWMVKLAPYFQIPLKGIGHGNLKLYTIGFKASVQFQTFRPN